MSPRIKNQHAAVINNVDGDQMVYGGQHGTVITSTDARRAVHQLRDALAGAALDDATAAEARARVAEIDLAVHAPEPDKERAARPVQTAGQAAYRRRIAGNGRRRPDRPAANPCWLAGELTERPSWACLPCKGMTGARPTAVPTAAKHAGDPGPFGALGQATAQTGFGCSRSNP